MPHFADDFVDHLARELNESRRMLTRVLDRTDALATLHAYAVEMSQRLQRPLTAHDLLTSHRDERERAELRLLVQRIAPLAGDLPASAPEERAVGL